jgi:membrane protein DedA with SNARE-associated domain
MEEQVLAFFAQYTYHPFIVYAAIWGAMFICSLGVPIPEEVIIISAGIVGHMALNPAEYPPPYPGAKAVHPYTLALVTFAAVVVTDFFIFWMGKFFGGKIFRSRWLKKYFSDEKMAKVQGWAKKYGYLTPGVFRFIPGVRFPGHLMCGALGVPPWAFIMTDGLAALVSVPTQVLLVSFYGRDIIMKMKEFKLYLLIAIAILVIAYLTRRFVQNKRMTVFN